MNAKEREPLVNAETLEIFKNYRKTVLRHVKKRREERNYEAPDETIVDMLASNIADWIYLERHASKSPEELAKYADALNKLFSTILHLCDQLILTPKARRQVLTELKEELKRDAQVQEFLEKLMGSKDPH